MPGRIRSGFSALCLFAFTTGCSTAPGQAPAVLTWEMPAQPSGGEGGLVGNHPGELQADADGRFIGNNAGGLTGTIQGPAAGLIGNNAAGLVSNNAAGMTSTTLPIMGNNGGNFRVQAADTRFVAAPGVKVTAIDDQGRQVSDGSVMTDAQGRYHFERLRPSGAVVFVVATYVLEGHTVTLMAATPAPRDAGAKEVAIDPATSLVAKKVSSWLRKKALEPQAIRPAELERMVEQVGAVLTDRAIAEAVVLTEEGASAAFDRMASEHPGLQAAAAGLEQAEAAPTVAPAPEPRQVDTLVGSGAAGWKDGRGADAQLHYPYGIATDGRGTLYVADYQNHRIRKVSVDGTVTTLAGTGEAGYRDGAGAQAQFANPRGLAVDGAGALIVVDTGNMRLRRIAPDGTVSTLAGSGETGFADGEAASARFADPRGVAVGPDGRIYVADTGNFRIRVLSTAGQVSTLAVVGEGTPASPESQLKGPYGVAVDARGQVYVADATTNAIETISPTGEVVRFGGAGAWGLQDGAADAARFKSPVGLSVDPQGNLYVADFFNHSIRKLTSDGRVTTLAGDGSPGSTNGDGPGARFYGPYGLAVGADHRLYVADTSNHLIRTILLP